jgi:hypothetical protein
VQPLSHSVIIFAHKPSELTFSVALKPAVDGQQVAAVNYPVPKCRSRRNREHHNFGCEVNEPGNYSMEITPHFPVICVLCEPKGQ